MGTFATFLISINFPENKMLSFIRFYHISTTCYKPFTTSTTMLDTDSFFFYQPSYVLEPEMKNAERKTCLT